MRLGLAATVVLYFCTCATVAFAHSSGGLPPDHPKDGSRPKALPSTGSFVNFETAHVHPLDINPSGTVLAVCNTPDARVELYTIDSGTGDLAHTDSIPVGYDPVSVRFRSDTELWAVNHISDSVSIIDVASGHVIGSIQTDDEPADAVFFTDSGSSDNLAAVSCSRVDTIQIYDADTLALVDTLDVMGEDPRALATDGAAVFAAIFNSGNGSTIIGHVGGETALSDGTNPYGGFNPPFNNGIPGTAWETPAGSVTPTDLANDGKPFPPFVGLILRKDYSDLAGDGLPKWKDDNGADWTEFVRGAKAGTARRLPGWDVIDNDVLRFTSTGGASAIDTGFGDDGYVVNQMTTCMALARNPVDGSIAMVGTDATNEVRFEPNIAGTFTRVRLSLMNGTTGAVNALVDLNEEHLNAAQSGGNAYEDGSVPQSERDKSIGDPRGIAYHPSGARLYITGMGSNNVVVASASTGARLGGVGHSIEVGTGPTGAKHHATLDRLYVVNKFSASVSVLDTSTVGSETVVQTEDFYDPTPEFINVGRKHLYDTHANSGLGQIACASCHIDSAMDRLAWDLGDPLGEMKETTLVDLMNPGPGEHNLSFTNEGDFDDFHFMKGPMTTQTLKDIIGKEPHHWRGDRDGIEEFAAAFAGLQGRDAALDSASMQEFEDFLSTIHFGPNPFRALDNSLPGGPKFVGGGTNPLLPLEGMFSRGRFTPAGTPLPDGDAWRGFQLYVDGDPDAVFPDQPPLDSSFQCVSCHSLPTGAGSIDFFPAGGSDFEDIPPGPNGERHMSLVSVDGTGEKAFKTAHLRNQLDKKGLYYVPDLDNGGQPRLSRQGFGVLHDGSVAGLDEFLSSDVFQMKDDQDIADVIAFTLCVNGDDFPALLTLSGAPTGFPAGIPGARAPGPDGGDTQTAHAATGKQVTITSSTPPAGDMDFINTLIALADSGNIDLIVKGDLAGEARGWWRGEEGGKAVGTFQSDINGVTHSLSSLLNAADSGAGLTFTAVPAGSGERMGVDRDEDGDYDFFEILNGSNPADPNSVVQNVPASDQDVWIVAMALLLGTALLVMTVSARRRPEA